MNSKSYLAIFAVFLIVVASLGFTQADWLDDLNEGTSRLLSTVNENAGKINHVAGNIRTIGQILRDADPGSDESDE